MMWNRYPVFLIVCQEKKDSTVSLIHVKLKFLMIYLYFSTYDIS